MQNWKLIFNTQGYDYIFVYDKNHNKYLNFFYEHENELALEKSFFFLMPLQGFQFNKENIDPAEYNSTYAPLLKGFMEDTSKKILFAEETILHILVKEEKRLSFLKFLSNNNKTLVLFHNNKDFYIRNENEKVISHSLNTTMDSIIENSLLTEKIDSIQQVLNNTHNPFKDPFNAYEKSLIMEE